MWIVWIVLGEIQINAQNAKIHSPTYSKIHVLMPALIILLFTNKIVSKVAHQTLLF